MAINKHTQILHQDCVKMRVRTQGLSWEGLFLYDMSRPELSVLVEELHDVKTKWYSIGIQLKVPESRLDEIERTSKDDLERAFRLMIREWLKQVEPEPTWAGIAKVLRCRSVNEQLLAENLEERYNARSTAGSATPLDATDSTAVAVPFLSQASANATSGSEQVLDPSVRKEMEELHQKFEGLRMDVYDALSKKPPDLNQFRVFVSSPPPAWKRQKPLTDYHHDRIMKEDTFHGIYGLLSRQYINWYNYELLKSIVDKYASPEIKQQMQDYCTKLNDFEERTNLDSVKNTPLCQPQQDSVAVTVNIPNHQCDQFHLSDSRKMQHALADEAGIDRGAIRLQIIVQSSVEIIFLVPLALAPYLIVSSVCPLLTSQEPLPENVCDRRVRVIHTEEAFRLMGRTLTPLTPALPAAPPLHRSSVSLNSSFSDEPRPKPISVLRPQPTLDPHHVQVFHNKVLDAGDSTVVCKARLNHLPCVAKYVHPKLVESNEWPLEKFLQGCKFLENCRHPNIVPFLGTHYDDSLKVPVLLMEQMEQSLHNYLEQAAHRVPIHFQLDICHDIAQGLEYIHSREYIHGDLTATNILLQGRRAKIGGMMTLQCKSPDAELSLCPGTPAYMPVRSFSFPDYDESIDCFSFGVLAIHIATGEIPSPVSYTTKVSGEIERYSESIAKVATDHPMYPIILQCLKDEPSAASLCDKLSDMKESSAYKTSLFFETFHVLVLSRFVQQNLREKSEEFKAMKEQHEARLQAEKQRMEANFQEEREQLKSEAKEKATQLEQDLKREIHRIMSTCEEVEKEKEEWKTKSEKEKQDMQERNDDLLSKLKQLESTKEKLEADKQELRGKLEEADQGFARLLQESAAH